MNRFWKIIAIAIATAYLTFTLSANIATATIAVTPSDLVATEIISTSARESSSLQMAFPSNAEIEAKTKVVFEQIFQKFGAVNILIIFLVTLGPLKLIVPFAKLTANGSATLRHRLALRSFGISTLVILGVALFCNNILKAWQIDVSVMLMTTGIILFLVALQKVLAQYTPTTTNDKVTANPSLNATIHPLVFPNILPPYGIAVVVTMSATFGRMEIPANLLFLLLFLVMLLNLVAMLLARPILHLIKPVTLKVLGFVFGVMQIALGLDMILAGIKIEAMTLLF